MPGCSESGLGCVERTERRFRYIRGAARNERTRRWVGQTYRTPRSLSGACGPGPGSGLAQHTLDLEGDLDLLAHDGAAAVERHGDVDAELAAADRGGGREAGARATVGVRAEAVDLEGEGDGAGDALDRQLAVERVVVAVGADRRAVERPGRVGLDLEEVGGADVAVALGVADVDRAGVDRGGHRRVAELRRGRDLTAEGAQPTAYLAHHHVPHGEGDIGVHRVDVPGADHVAGDLGAGRSSHGDLPR